VAAEHPNPRSERHLDLCLDAAQMQPATLVRLRESYFDSKPQKDGAQTLSSMSPDQGQQLDRMPSRYLLIISSSCGKHDQHSGEVHRSPMRLLRGSLPHASICLKIKLILTIPKIRQSTVRRYEDALPAHLHVTHHALAPPPSADCCSKSQNADSLQRHFLRSFPDEPRNSFLRTLYTSPCEFTL
jgi:hypothetical protein